MISKEFEALLSEVEAALEEKGLEWLVKRSDVRDLRHVLQAMDGRLFNAMVVGVDFDRWFVYIVAESAEEAARQAIRLAREWDYETPPIYHPVRVEVEAEVVASDGITKTDKSQKWEFDPAKLAEGE